ncbi:phosphatase PAP2 family protein [soil metagenome]
MVTDLVHETPLRGGCNGPRQVLRRADTAVLVALQDRLAQSLVITSARALSRFGEHAAGWLIVGGLAAMTRRGPRRRQWIKASGSVLAAHAAAVVLKRIVRRPRPDDPRIRVLATTPSRLSFPSAHVSSSTAAAITYGQLLGPAPARLALPMLVGPMAISRLVLGVHFPTDVVAAAALGWVVVRGIAPRGVRR